MRRSWRDLAFTDATGTGRVRLDDNGDGTVKRTIDKIKRHNPFGSALIHGSLDEARAAPLRDAFDAWLRRHDPAPIPPEAPRR